MQERFFSFFKNYEFYKTANFLLFSFKHLTYSLNLIYFHSRPIN